jgi:hypothetical protein
MKNIIVYIYIYIYAVANSVHLQLQLSDFYNIIFKIRHTFYIAPVSVPTPMKNSRHASEKRQFQKLCD